MSSSPPQFTSPGSPQDGPETLQLRIDKAIELNGTVDPQALHNFNGVDYTLENLPTADIRAMAGYGHPQPFFREVVPRPDGKEWLYTPNMCLVAGGIRGVWVDPEHLACPGCGLDFT